MRLRSARPLFAVLLVLVLVAGLAGCKGKAEEVTTTPTPTAAAGQNPGEPRRGGTVVIGWSAAPTGVNEFITQSTAITSEVTPGAARLTRASSDSVAPGAQA